MNEINTGGPAFPAHTISMYEGMTLRDYFAAKAMQGILAGNSTKVHEIAQASYIVADAMLKERSK